MKTYLECIPCFMQQALRAGRMATDSKGQGNYEGLSDINRPLFFLLKAKCKVISKDLGVNKNDIILKGINLV